MAPLSHITVDAYRPEWREDVLAFATDYGLVWGPEPAVFSWKYERPLPASCPQTVPRLWVAREGSRVLGTFGTQPVGVQFRGDRQPAAFAMDVHLHADLRGQGIAKRFLSRFADSCPLHLMPFSSQQAHRVYLHLGYQELTGFESFLGFRKSPSVLLRLLLARLRNGRVGNNLEPLTELAPRLAQRIEGCRVEAGNDRQALDRFLDGCRGQFELAVVRDWATLEWRYLEHPRRSGAVFSIRDPAGGLRAVFALAWKELRGLRALALCDLFCPPDEDRLATSVVTSMPTLARVARADLYTMLASAERSKEWAGGYPRRRPLLCSVKLPPETQPPPDFTRWQLTGGDSDYVT